MSDDPSLEEAQLYGRLRAARRGLFVGREAEIGLFREALGGRPDDADTLAVLCLHGPGGIGKSTLLQRFEDEAAAAERPVVRVDLRRTTCWPVLWGCGRTRSACTSEPSCWWTTPTSARHGRKSFPTASSRCFRGALSSS